MKKVYAVHFLSMVNPWNADVGIICEAYLKQLKSKKYDKNERVKKLPQIYHYFSDVDLQAEDIVIIRRAHVICVGLISHEVIDQHSARATRAIIAKIDFGKTLEKEARKTRLLSQMEKHIKEELPKAIILAAAEHFAANDTYLAAQLAELKKLDKE